MDKQEDVPIIILGEILDGIIIFLVISNFKINIKLYIDNIYYANYLVEHLTTRLLVPYSDSNYLFTNSQGGIISQHNLSIFHNNPLKLIFLSCDMPAADTRNPLINNFINQSGICFHLGDNIYGDRAYNSINANYKDIYLNTWRRWSSIMSNFSHLMIADDHEVKDGFNILDNYDNYQKMSEALSCYKLFQTSLQHDLINGRIIKQVDKNTTVYCISRTINNVTPINIIKQMVHQFKNNIIIATSSAPIPMNSKIPYEMVFGSYGWKSRDLLELYDLCFELLESNRVDNVILIGGDLHFGISGIIKRGNLKIHVYVTSAISAHPTPIENILASAMTNNFCFDKYSIECTSRADRNYLTVELPIKKDNPGVMTYNNEHWPKSITSYVEEMFYIIKPKINFNLVVDAVKQL